MKIAKKLPLWNGHLARYKLKVNYSHIARYKLKVNYRLEACPTVSYLGCL